MTFHSDSPARDWSEDFELENGAYMCRCHCCREVFVGHKRRITCKVCATVANMNPEKSREISDRMRASILGALE